MTRPDLTRALVLEAPVRVPDGGGGYAEDWSPLGTVWADVSPRGAGREGVSGSKLALKITLRAVPQEAASRPKPGMRFRERARLYEIEAVTEADAAGRYLICFAREEVGT
ncbi:MAG: head-tail adaptor protein [Pseudomonadota bacterium]